MKDMRLTESLPKVVSIMSEDNCVDKKKDSQFNLKYSLIRGKTLKLLNKRKMDQERMENMMNSKPIIMSEGNDCFNGMMILQRSRNDQKSKDFLHTDNNTPVQFTMFKSMNTTDSLKQMKTFKLTPFQLYMKKIHMDKYAFKERRMMLQPKIGLEFQLTNYNSFIVNSLGNNHPPHNDLKRKIRERSLKDDISKGSLNKLNQAKKMLMIKECKPLIGKKKNNNYTQGNNRSCSFNDLLFVKHLCK